VAKKHSHFPILLVTTESVTTEENKTCLNEKQDNVCVSATECLELITAQVTVWCFVEGKIATKFKVKYLNWNNI